jgi:hypothetical protein
MQQDLKFKDATVSYAIHMLHKSFDSHNWVWNNTYNVQCIYNTQF